MMKRNFNICSLIFALFLLGSEVPRKGSAISLESCKTFLKNCFLDLSDNLQCHIDFNPKNECSLKDADTLCQSFEQALNCSMSIRDLGCEFGKGTMEAWMTGLMGSYKTLCILDNLHTHIHNLIDIPNCWNIGQFFTCTEEKVGITHIVDLLTHELDIRECNVLMITVALCNAKAEKRRYVCRESSTAVVEALTSFFAESSCMLQITKELMNDHCESVAQKRATIAGLSTFVLMILVVAGVTFFLVKRRTVVLNTRFRFTNDEDNSAFIS